MRQLTRTTRDSAVFLLVQPSDDRLHMYRAFSSCHGLAVIAVSNAWDARSAAPKADVIVTGILRAGSMDGVELSARLRGDKRAKRMYDNQGRAPVLQGLGEPDPKQPIASPELRTCARALEHRQLLTERHVLECDCAVSAADMRERATHRDEPGQHEVS
ncbi:MAG: hypothetical protein ABJA98_18370 [Acidobacteriota bacterium]